MLKKFMTSALAVMLGAVMIVGCSSNEAAPSAATAETTEASTDTAEAETTAEGEAAPSGDTIRIGALGPLSGDVSQYGVAAINGAKMYIEEINAAGGVLGKPVELLIEDEEGQSDKAVTAYNKLVNDDKVVALIGDVTSKPSIAVAQIAAQTGFPVISPTGTAPDITLTGPSVFRACFLDSFQGKKIAEYASQKLNAKTAAILYNSADDYSDGLREAFIAQAKESGLEIVAEEAYSETDVDYKAQLTGIAAKNPDVLFLPDYYSTVALIAAQVKEVGLTSTLIGADGWDGVLNATNDAANLEGAYYINHYSAQDPNEVVQNFLKTYKETYQMDANSFSALGYDAAKILCGAIEKAQSTDPAAIVKAMQESSTAGVTASQITFDQNGDPIKEASVLKIVNGEYTLVEKIS